MSENCDHEWQDTDVWCELCGEHSGVLCVKCYEMLDFVWDDDPRK